jgi:iron-sulfur cluster repair protein YtfE (RIC family)
MQQHNMKEENILYPMCDARLAGRAAELGAELSRQLAGEAVERG